MARTYDLIVIGTGRTSGPVINEAAAKGWKIAAVDKGPFGGTCSLRGCIPKKVLTDAAELSDKNRRLHELGIISKLPEYSWLKLMEHKHSFTDPVDASTRKWLKDLGVDAYEGIAKFVSEDRLEVADQQIQAKQIVLANGSVPRPLEFEGAEQVITSDDFLNLTHLPKSICFIGAGYVSFEFAHIAARFGAQVTMLEHGERPLKQFDADIVEVLVAASKEVGIDIILQADAQAVEKQGNGFKVDYGKGTAEADLVVHGAGRVPATAGMNLEAANIEMDLGAVVVDEYFRSVSNPRVWAAGDVAKTGPPLSPTATTESKVIAANLLGAKQTRPDYRFVPSVAFTTPPIARVGYLEEEATAAAINYDVHTGDMSQWFDAKKANLKHAAYKTLTEKGSGKIIGAHIIGNHADDIINMLALAASRGLTAEEFSRIDYVFPTSSGDSTSMFG